MGDALSEVEGEFENLKSWNNDSLDSYSDSYRIGTGSKFAPRRFWLIRRDELPFQSGLIFSYRIQF